MSLFAAVQIIPASVQSATPTTIKGINSSAKAAKVQRAPRISGEDRSSPGNRTGIFTFSFGIYNIYQIMYVLFYFTTRGPVYGFVPQWDPSAWPAVIRQKPALTTPKGPRIARECRPG